MQNDHYSQTATSCTFLLPVHRYPMENEVNNNYESNQHPKILVFTYPAYFHLLIPLLRIQIN